VTRTYDVHLFPVVRMKIPGVQAESQTEAIKKAIEGFAFSSPFVFGDAEYADELEFFLVDEVGDEEYERTQWYEYDTEGQLVAGMNGKWARPTAEASAGL
jgi:hypothetical protein